MSSLEETPGPEMGVSEKGFILTKNDDFLHFFCLHAHANPLSGLNEHVLQVKKMCGMLLLVHRGRKTDYHTHTHPHPHTHNFSKTSNTKSCLASDLPLSRLVSAAIESLHITVLSG